MESYRKWCFGFGVWFLWMMIFDGLYPSPNTAESIMYYLAGGLLVFAIITAPPKKEI